jgi:hypothetical protein
MHVIGADLLIKGWDRSRRVSLLRAAEGSEIRPRHATDGCNSRARPCAASMLRHRRAGTGGRNGLFSDVRSGRSGASIANVLVAGSLFFAPSLSRRRRAVFSRQTRDVSGAEPIEP